MHGFDPPGRRLIPAYHSYASDRCKAETTVAKVAKEWLNVCNVALVPTIGLKEAS